jgi:hypothetical protein
MTLGVLVLGMISSRLGAWMGAIGGEFRRAGLGRVRICPPLKLLNSGKFPGGSGLHRFSEYNPDLADRIQFTHTGQTNFHQH